MVSCISLPEALSTSSKSVVASQLVRRPDLLRFTSPLPGFSIFRQFFCFPPSFLPLLFSKALCISSSSTVQTVLLRVSRSYYRPCLLLGYKGFRHPAGNSFQSTRPQDMSPSTNTAEIVAENTPKARPEIASNSCCCHRTVCFYARSPPSYMRPAGYCMLA